MERQERRIIITITERSRVWQRAITQKRRGETYVLQKNKDSGQERTVTHDRKENGRKRQSDPGRKGERVCGDPGREERRDNDS